MSVHKVADLCGPMLDGAVALAEGLTFTNHRHNWCLVLDEAEDEMRVYEPSVDWDLAGPIIERERISLHFEYDPEHPQIWHALTHTRPLIKASVGTGERALIAAMRAYVASKFGEMVELP